jgi:hypothetical protein
MFKRFLKALNDNAQMIHDIQCGIIPLVESKLGPVKLFCNDCKMEIEHNGIEHRCIVRKI